MYVIYQMCVIITHRIKNRVKKNLNVRVNSVFSVSHKDTLMDCTTPND